MGDKNRVDGKQLARICLIRMGGLDNKNGRRVEDKQERRQELEYGIRSGGGNTREGKGEQKTARCGRGQDK